MTSVVLSSVNYILGYITPILIIIFILYIISSGK